MAYNRRTNQGYQMPGGPRNPRSIRANRLPQHLGPRNLPQQPGQWAGQIGRVPQNNPQRLPNPGIERRGGSRLMGTPSTARRIGFGQPNVMTPGTLPGPNAHMGSGGPQNLGMGGASAHMNSGMPRPYGNPNVMTPGTLPGPSAHMGSGGPQSLPGPSAHMGSGGPQNIGGPQSLSPQPGQWAGDIQRVPHPEPHLPPPPPGGGSAKGGMQKNQFNMANNTYNQGF